MLIEYENSNSSWKFKNSVECKTKVTKLGCGSYSIGIGANHSVFDGPAAYEFLKAWASNLDIMKENKCS